MLLLYTLNTFSEIAHILVFYSGHFFFPQKRKAACFFAFCRSFGHCLPKNGEEGPPFFLLDSFSTVVL